MLPKFSRFCSRIFALLLTLALTVSPALAASATPVMPSESSPPEIPHLHSTEVDTMVTIMLTVGLTMLCLALAGMITLVITRPRDLDYDDDSFYLDDDDTYYYDDYDD